MNLIPADTAAILQSDARKCDSRSLFMDRFARPDLKSKDRRPWFEQLLKKEATRVCRPPVLPASQSHLFHAQLQSRLMVNMAGGVMENAGLCLDRFGLPYIPGSAVKGCARRMATQELLESDSADAKANLLFKLTLIFGWGDTDWNPGRKSKNDRETEPHSDFWWAMTEDSGDHSADDRRDEVWRMVSVSVANRLLDRLNIRSRKYPEAPWKDLPNFAGGVSFLPAHPVDVAGAQLPVPVPTLGKLELDVVTCHHSEYYRDDREIATDDEDPNPVIFPTVAAGHVFAFAIGKLRGTGADVLQARTWLANGLQTFGLGAKTAAGYGWFDASESAHNAVQAAMQARLEREAAEARRRSEQKAAEQAEQERIARKREMEAAKASMTDEEMADFDLDQMDPNHRLQWTEKIDQRTDHEKLAIYRLLHSRNVELWKELRSKAEQGKQKDKKRFGPIVQEMFKLAKQRKEKMP